MRAGLCLAVLLCISGISADDGIPEPADSQVHVVTYDSFDRFIKKYPLVIMEFYAPWCGHCQNLAPTYREAAKLMASEDLPYPVTFAKFNDGSEYNRQLRGGAEDMFNYTGYPALLVFKKKKIPVANKEHWVRKYKKRQWQYYGGGRDTPEDFIFYLSAVSKSLDPFDEERKVRPGFYKKGGKHATDKILDLEPDGEMGFNNTILADPSNTVWIVEFYSDRCPFCNSLAPEITKAATEVLKAKGGKIKFAAVNSRVYDEIATQHEVTSWPWVAGFYRGKKIEDMAGLGGSESVVRFANEMFDKAWKKNPPPNTFLASLGASGDAGAAGGEDNSADWAKLEALLVDAMEYNLKSETGAEKLREKATKGDIKAVVADLEKKLKPIHDLKAKLKAAEGKTEL